MFDVKVNSSSVLALLDTIAPRVHEALLPVIKSDAASIQSQAKALASGAVLKERSGKYVGSIKQRVYDSRKRILGKVYSRDPRAGLFEFGGSVAAREILPDTARALAFMGSVGQVFAAAVHRPVVDYKPKPTIHAAFNSMKDGVQDHIQQAGLEAAIGIL